MKKAILALLLGATAACQTMKPTCDDTKRAADIAARKLANVLNCQNPAAIARDLHRQVEKAQLCDNREQSSLGEAICRPVSSYVVSQLVKQIPEAWACQGGEASQITVNTLYTACVQGSLL